ncbi:ornithine cyclodeaminase/mu-crystallin [Leptothrix cholodnii SP-6]|uniref:Ornithine cyclodeaminase/mu-crystallin n=1 Tax=Leptothrix cholodnii (strain ATCC 51168 / LMG 8142 / SP-6) TaxID=395495 RepID=B1Y0B6_LEPCP|nr:ornithine cyclodeaminase family protein [Leptothrix cholodnii]ACB36595.1 ornithine cyclodeaminase/mu-crystallin [Leptothrix cholodnii SP-6]
MQHITDSMIDALIRPEDAQTVLLDAFQHFGAGRAAMQERIRTEAGGVKLSTLGAVIPDQQVVGAKVYTTIAGQFSFVILLFSAVDGQPLASFDAGAITRLRTAACSVIAARHLARADSRRMALFGAGVQGCAHALQMSRTFDLTQISVCDPHADAARIERLQRDCGVAVRLCGADEAIADADLIVTASRATQPLFAGAAIRPGTFVAAIGSSLPHTRELDDVALARAACIAVEWRTQSMREAGDLALADPAVVPAHKIVELAELVGGQHPGRQSAEAITIYKSVGVGLEDVAMAGLAWRLLGH